MTVWWGLLAVDGRGQAQIRRTQLGNISRCVRSEKSYSVSEQVSKSQKADATNWNQQMCPLDEAKKCV